MSLKSYQDTIADKLGMNDPPQPKSESEEIDDLRDEVAQLRHRVAILSAALNARQKPKAQEPVGNITTYASEKELWN